MNADKARELFSEKREGTLSPSLSEAMQQAMRSQPGLQAEYDEFDRVVTSLETAQHDSVEVPFDLHDRIMARVDKSVFEAKRSAKSGFFAGWRLALVGGVACIAIVGTVISIFQRGTGPGTADLAGVSGTRQLDVSVKQNEVHVTHGAGNLVVVVKNELTGDLVDRFSLEGKALDSVLTNKTDQPVLLSVQSESDQILIVLPGNSVSTETVGSGTVKDLALALAGASQTPVQIKVKDPLAKVAWELDSGDPVKSRATSGSFTVDVRKGMLYLAD